MRQRRPANCSFDFSGRIVIFIDNRSGAQGADIFSRELLQWLNVERERFECIRRLVQWDNALWEDECTKVIALDD